MKTTTWSTSKEEKMTEFVCYRRNTLQGYGIESPKTTYTSSTIVEAAMAYWNQHKAWPDEIYAKSDKAEAEPFMQLEALRYNTNHIREQRDNFANSLAVVEKQRDQGYRQIERIYNAIRLAISEVGMKIRETKKT